MSDEKDRPSGDQPERVNRAFDALHESLGDRPTDEERDRLAKLREAATAGDAAGMRARLAEVKEQHGWLYDEMARHPEVATLVNELALWGF
jgi:hypothetical protein